MWAIIGSREKRLGRVAIVREPYFDSLYFKALETAITLLRRAATARHSIS